jgi:hypothetical protein
MTPRAVFSGGPKATRESSSWKRTSSSSFSGFVFFIPRQYAGERRASLVALALMVIAQDAGGLDEALQEVYRLRGICRAGPQRVL